MTRWPVPLIALMLLTTSAVASQPYVVLRTRAQPFKVTDTDTHAIPLDDRGRTHEGWTYDAAVKPMVVITYSAECWSQGSGSYVSITILVDKRPAEPKGGGDMILCADSPESGNYPVLATRVVIAQTKYLQQHQVEILAKGVNTSMWQVAHSALTVIAP